MKTIIAVVSLVVVAAIIYFVYQYIYLPKKNTPKTNDVANAEPNGKTITIFLFHVNWCPHCKTAIPEWNMFRDEYNGKLVNGYKIECIDTDCTENKKPEIANVLEKYKIEYFPTVKGVMIGADGKNVTVDYDAKVNRSNLGQFVISLSQT